MPVEDSIRRWGRPRKITVRPPPRFVPLAFEAERQALAVRRDVASSAATINPEARASPSLAVAPALRWGLSSAQRAEAERLLADRQTHGISGLAANSRRTMAADWLTWQAYCLWAHAPVLPALFADVRRFIELLVDAGRQRATVEHHLWTLRQMHRRLGLADPLGSLLAKDWWRDLARERLWAEQRQAAPLGLREITKMTRALLDPALPVSTRKARPDQIATLEALQRARRLRDAAIINAAYDLLSRSSEVATLTWDRLATADDGSGTYRLGRSKTDQEGRVVTQYLRPETMTHLAAWRAVAPSSSYVFTSMSDRTTDGEDGPLTAGQLGRIFRRAAALAGVAALRYSGHSARVGAAQDMVEAGATADEAQQAGRWKDGRMVAKYAARPLASRAGKKRFRKLARLLED